MRLTAIMCQKRKCHNFITNAGFRFCMQPSCGKPKEGVGHGEEE